MTSVSSSSAQSPAPTSRTAPRRRVLARLARRPAAGIAAAVLLLLALAAALAPLVAPYPPQEIHADAIFQNPSPSYWLGTDELGRDMLSRVIYGTRLTLAVAAGSVVVAMVVGLLWGLLASGRGVLLPEVLMRLVDGVMAIPTFLLALLFVASLGSSLTILIVVIGLLNAPVVARLVRSSMLQERSMEYALASQAGGMRPVAILLKELLPNIVNILLVQASLVGAFAVLTEAGLSVLGLGVQPPQASLGTLMLQGYQNIYTYPAYALWPGIVVVTAVWALNSLGDTLREVLSPHDAT